MKGDTKLRARLKSGTLLLVIRDTDTNECIFNSVAGRRVFEERFQDQEHTASIGPCGPGSHLARLRNAGVPETVVREVAEYLGNE
jgi:hypothetical protein